MSTLLFQVVLTIRVAIANPDDVIATTTSNQRLQGSTVGLSLTSCWGFTT
jgi:hypothetical protein